MTEKMTGLQRAVAEKNSRLRDRIKAVKDELVVKQKERVEVHGLVFDVHPMPIGRRLDLYDLVQRPGATSATADYLVTLVHESTHDAETGERVWGADEAAEVRALPAEIFGPLSLAAQRVNAITKEADDAVGNDSAPTGSDDSSSGSPATSEA